MFSSTAATRTGSGVVSGASGSKSVSVQKRVVSVVLPTLVMLWTHMVGMSMATGSSPDTSNSSTSAVNILRKAMTASPSRTTNRSILCRW